jgi:hypothetical protein
MWVSGLVLVISGAGPAWAAGPMARQDAGTGEVVLTNRRLELRIATRAGLNPHSLRDTQSGRVFADADYVWPGGQRAELLGEPAIIEDEKGGRTVLIKAQVGAIEVTQVFSAPGAEADVITELLTIRNPGGAALDTSAFACGFAKRFHDGQAWSADMAKARFCDVPYRYHPETGELCDYTPAELDTRANWFSTARSAIYNRQKTHVYGAEAWSWYGDGGGLLIGKYNPDAMEWSLLETLPATGAGKVLRFGGAGRWKMGDPEGAARLAPGGIFTFGTTRYQALDGDWKAAYAAYRRFSARRGHRVPAGFDPPVHWNELYDNPLWWLPNPDTEEGRQKYYQHADMKVEADKALELGCQCLYLDPGWDTTFGSNIWDESRLGAQTDFVQWLKDKYGMKLALHTPLAPWSNPAGYPPECQRMDKGGHRLGEMCVASTVYMDTKVARLKELCKDGAYFLMYDGSWFPGECWDKTHGHSLPVTHQEHVDAILKIAQRVHAAYPQVLIEQHDPMTGPGTPRYVPTYFLHAKPGAFDELWGYEFMVEPLDDILSHRAFALYTVNLAYNIPIYLHIDLRKDNANALMFWWYASTCRHLGVGGKAKDPAVWAAHKQAMQTYLPLKRFFAQGEFYGIEETVHAHTLPELKQCVVNCFNLEEMPVQKKVTFRLADVGLPAGPVQVEGGTVTANDGAITLEVNIPARGHQLLKITVSPA